MNYKELISEIEKGKINSSYFLVGENTFLKEEIVSIIESNLIHPKFISTDKLVIYGEDCQNPVSWLLTPPLGSEKKLLILKHTEQLPPEEKKNIQKWLDSLSKNSTASDSVLILMAGVKASKMSFNNTITCNCYKLKGQAIGWLKTFTKKKGFDIEIEAAQMLHQLFGDDLYILSTEIEKLMNFIEPRTLIKLDDVQQVESLELAGSIFDLTHAIAEKKLKTAERLLHLLFQLGKKPPSTLLWSIGAHFDTLLKLKEGKEVKVHKFYLSRYKQQAKDWEYEDLLNVFSLLFKTDLAIKTSQAKPQFLLEELIYKLC
ncbi:DNA polymerase III subunit delta [candidate division WOR-3 bacterium]|nr:DNA polymerase III subunit delta [candidate division WOR-3 bacterium]